MIHRAPMATDYYYLNKDDCSEIIVMPPIGAAFDEPKWQAFVETALSVRYPPYKFKVAIEGRRRDETFVLIPVLGPVEGGGPMLNAPDVELMCDMGRFLHETFIRDRRATVH
jgi:hypothetical protein